MMRLLAISAVAVLCRTEAVGVNSGGIAVGSERVADGRALLFPAPAAPMPQLVGLDAKCSRSGMAVTLEFDREFPGVVYSKGHFYDPACNYVTVENSGRKTFIFNVPIDGCGTKGQLGEATPGRDMYFENTLIIQNDALIQEVWDTARNIRCTWQHTVQKSVSFTPFKVYEPVKVGVQLDKRSVNTLMEIQQGPSPFSSPATGYVYMGDDTSVVIYVQDSGRQMDANVISCNASSAGGAMVPLLDARGCVLRPDLLTPFAKTRQTNGVQADLMLYSYLKAFRIGESPEFLIKCQLEVCEGQCQDPCSGGPAPPHARRKREAPTLVELERGVVVVTRDQAAGIGECWMTGQVWAGVVVVACVVVALSCLTCLLLHKTNALRQQLNAKQRF